ncbi:uncharacterized protein LOC34620609 [Cyclospora cayetanensis]|uniref:Uncharacterized protein LOC34620609 n=1 Tax=Cyclospora cayetanensis TaxID=88456 RepID=A0A6P6S2P3_9EIME|nr:uncharacterized protein LOC34620609 [Cyclospora cayetanensis]
MRAPTTDQGAPSVNLFGPPASPPGAALLVQPSSATDLLQQAADTAQRIAKGLSLPLGSPLGAPPERPPDTGEADEGPTNAGPPISTRPMSFLYNDDEVEEDAADEEPDEGLVPAVADAVEAAPGRNTGTAQRASWVDRSWLDSPASAASAVTTEEEQSPEEAQMPAVEEPVQSCSLVEAATATEALSCQVQQLGRSLSLKEVTAAREALLTAAESFPTLAAGHLEAAKHRMQQAVASWRDIGNSQEEQQQQQPATTDGETAEKQFDSVSFMARAVHQAQQRMQGLRAAVLADSSSRSRGDSGSKNGATPLAVKTGWWEATGLPISRADLHRRVCGVFSQKLPSSINQLLQAVRISLEQQQQPQKWGPANDAEEELEGRVLGALLTSLKAGNFAAAHRPWAQQLREQVVAYYHYQQQQQQPRGSKHLHTSEDSLASAGALIDGLFSRRRLQEALSSSEPFVLENPPLESLHGSALESPWFPQLLLHVARGDSAYDIFLLDPQATQQQQQWAFVAVSLHPEKVRGVSDVLRVLRKAGEFAAAEAAGDAEQQEQQQIVEELLKLFHGDTSSSRNGLPPIAVYAELVVRDTKGDIVFGPAEMLCPHTTVPFTLIRLQQQQQDVAPRNSILTPSAMPNATFVSSQEKNSRESPLSSPWEPLMFEVTIKTADGVLLAGDDMRSLFYRSFGKAPVSQQQEWQHQQQQQETALSPSFEMRNAREILGHLIPEGTEGDLNKDCLGSPYLLLLRVAGPLPALAAAASEAAAAGGGAIAQAAAVEAREAELAFIVGSIASTVQVPLHAVQLCAVKRDLRRLAFRIKALEFEDPVIGAATWRRALLNAGAPIHKALLVDLTHPPAITRKQQQQYSAQDDLLTHFFAAPDLGPLGGRRAPERVEGKRQPAEEDGNSKRHQQKAATWVWLLVGVGGALLFAVGAVTAFLAYQVFQRRDAAKEAADADAPAAAAAAAALLAKAAQQKEEKALLEGSRSWCSSALPALKHPEHVKTAIDTRSMHY